MPAPPCEAARACGSSDASHAPIQPRCARPCARRPFFHAGACTGLSLWLPLLSSSAALPWRGRRRCGGEGCPGLLPELPTMIVEGGVRVCDRRFDRVARRGCQPRRVVDFCDVLWPSGASLPGYRAACHAAFLHGTPVAPVGFVVVLTCWLSACASSAGRSLLARPPVRGGCSLAVVGVALLGCRRCHR